VSRTPTPLRQRPLQAIRRAWEAFADATLSFLDEATFRVALASRVLTGRMPQQTHKRPWVRRVQTPLLIDVRDWTTDSLIFSVLVWPPLESGVPRHEAGAVQRDRARAITEAIAIGAAQKMWSSYWEVDYGLVWDNERECWVDGDGYRYDGSQFGVGSRSPEARRGRA
jgi:hypothetical protein